MRRPDCSSSPRCELADERCFGRIQWHHVVPKRLIKDVFPHGAVRPAGIVGALWEPVPRERKGQAEKGEVRLGLKSIIADGRNRAWVCSDHHERVENRMVVVPVSEEVLSFADDFGFEFNGRYWYRRADG